MKRRENPETNDWHNDYAVCVRTWIISRMYVFL